MTKTQLSSLAPCPEIYICDTFPLCQSLGQTQVCACVCTYGSAHPAVWPLYPWLAMPLWDRHIYCQCWLSCSNSPQQCKCVLWKKAAGMWWDEKSRANTCRISASGQINFSLNCHHEGLFFPSPSLWVVSLIYISE